jgi:hypothetical protein
MAFIVSTPQLGMQRIADISTTQQHPLGTIVRGYDTTLGEAEFIYLLGVVGTVVGSGVTYNATTYQTTLLSAGNLGAPVGFAMGANVASSYGWYQISGLAVAKKTAVKADPAVNAQRIYISGTAGRVMQTSSSGKQILGAARANLTTVTSTTSTVTLQINRPMVQGQIT